MGNRKVRWSGRRRRPPSGKGSTRTVRGERSTWPRPTPWRRTLTPMQKPTRWSVWSNSTTSTQWTRSSKATGRWTCMPAKLRVRVARMRPAAGVLRRPHAKKRNRRPHGREKGRPTAGSPRRYPGRKVRRHLRLNRKVRRNRRRKNRRRKSEIKERIKNAKLWTVTLRPYRWKSGKLPTRWPPRVKMPSIRRRCSFGYGMRLRPVARKFGKKRRCRNTRNS